MKVIIVENENFKKHRIGGISSYIKVLINYFEKNNVSYCCIGSGFENTNEKQKLEQKKYSLSKISLSNTDFFLKLFVNKKSNFKGIQNSTFHFHHPYMALALRSLKQNNVFILTIHSKQDQTFKDKRNSFYSFIYNYLTRLSLKLYDGIIADNQSLLDYYHSNFGVDIGKSSIISAPVDLNIFKPLDKHTLRQKYCLNETDRLILYAGRIEKEKNLELIIKSCKLLKDDIDQIKLWIVGEGSQLMRLKDHSQQIGFSEVSFIKTLSSRDLAEVMNCADVFAISSFHEGGPIVVKEALACELAVVSVDVGDVAEVINGLNGCFISSYDEKEFADNLGKALKYKGEYNYREKMLCYGEEVFGEKVMDVYRKFENELI